MEMRLEKNNCNLFRKTRNFYSVTPRLKLSDLDYLVKIEIRGGILKLSELNSLSNFMGGGGYSEAIRAELPVKFHVGGYSEVIRAGPPVKFHWGGILNFRIGVFCRIWTKISTITSSIFKYYVLFHECLGYYIYLLLFPIIYTLLFIFH